jgi:hypothetical protein
LASSRSTEKDAPRRILIRLAGESRTERKPHDVEQMENRGHHRGLAVGACAGSPAAALQCGDTIGPNISATLSGTLICDDVANGLTIVGPANLTLDGLFIYCPDLNQNGTTPSSGLRILGRNVRIDGTELNGGSVVFGRTGVEVAGEGRHKVETCPPGTAPARASPSRATTTP